MSGNLLRDQEAMSSKKMDKWQEGTGSRQENQTQAILSENEERKKRVVRTVNTDKVSIDREMNRPANHQGNVIPNRS